MKWRHKIIANLSMLVVSLSSIGMEERPKFVLPNLENLKHAQAVSFNESDADQADLTDQEHSTQTISLMQRTLIKAIVINDCSTVRRCLEKGINPNMGALIMTTGEHASMLPLSHLDVQSLASSFATIDKTTFVLYALHLAVLGDSPEIVKMLLRYGADVNVQVSNGLHAIQLAETKNSLEIIKLLIKHGAETPEQQEDGQHSHDYTEPDDTLALIELHAKYKASLNAPTSNHVKTPKKRHISFKDEKNDMSAQEIKLITRFYAEHDTGPYREKFGDISYIHAAAIDGNVAIAKLLVARGADISKRIVFTDGLQAIHLAALYGHADFIEWLISHGANLRTTATGVIRSVKKFFHKKCGIPEISKGMQALHFASSAGHLEIVKILVKSGIDSASQDESGNQAIHFASSRGHQAIIEWLVSHGADISAKNKQGKQPMDIALVCKHTKIAKWLKKNINPNKQSKKKLLNSFPSRRRINK